MILSLPCLSHSSCFLRDACRLLSEHYQRSAMHTLGKELCSFDRREDEMIMTNKILSSQIPSHPHHLSALVSSCLVLDAVSFWEQLENLFCSILASTTPFFNSLTEKRCVLSVWMSFLLLYFIYQMKQTHNESVMGCGKRLAVHRNLVSRNRQMNKSFTEQQTTGKHQSR